MNNKIKKIILASCIALATANLLYAMQQKSLLTTCAAFVAQNPHLESQKSVLPLECQKAIEDQVCLSWGWAYLQDVQSKIDIQKKFRWHEGFDALATDMDNIYRYGNLYRRKKFFNEPDFVFNAATWLKNDDIVIDFGEDRICFVDSDLNIKEQITWPESLRKIELLGDTTLVGLSERGAIKLFDIQSKKIFQVYEQDDDIEDIVVNGNNKEITFVSEDAMYFWDGRSKSPTEMIQLPAMEAPSIVSCQTDDNCYAISGSKAVIGKHDQLMIFDRCAQKLCEISLDGQEIAGSVFPYPNKIILIPWGSSGAFRIKNPINDVLLSSFQKPNQIEEQAIVNISSHPARKFIALALAYREILLLDWEHNTFASLGQKWTCSLNHPLHFNHKGTKLLDARMGVVCIWDTSEIPSKDIVEWRTKKSAE